MLDYLSWYGDMDFEAVPYNEVDAALLAQLAYVDLEGIVPGLSAGGSITMADAAAEFLALHGKDSIYGTPGVVSPLTALLPQAMASGKRFGGAILSRFRSRLDAETHEQFCAFCITLSNGLTYVAFRGTDDSITGWREDFEMTYETVPSQEHSVHYLNQVIRGLPEGDLEVGGHSKGGNLAVYGAAKVTPRYQDRIGHIWNFDGPGFDELVLPPALLAPIADRVSLIVPAFDVVGQLLDRQVPTKVVASTEEGIQQHSALSWEVLGPAFVEADRGVIQPEAKAVNEAFDRWLGSADHDERRERFSDLFDALERAGVRGLSDLYSGDPALLARVTYEVAKVPGESRAYVASLLGKLIGEMARRRTSEAIDGAMTSIQSLMEPPAAEVDPETPLSTAEMARYRASVEREKARQNLLSVFGQTRAQRRRTLAVGAAGGVVLGALVTLKVLQKRQVAVPGRA